VALQELDPGEEDDREDGRPEHLQLIRQFID
jgi:hypothetical protein